MKKHIIALISVLAAFSANAQNLNVTSGNVTYSYSLENVGEAAFAGGTSFGIQGKTFNLNAPYNLVVNAATIADNNVQVIYDGDKATVTIAGNIATKVDAVVKGAHVTLLQSGTVDEEITYTLKGSSNNGSLYMDGNFKSTFVLDGLTLNNPDSAAINIQDGKRINVVLNAGTTNTLTDGIRVADDGTDAHNACLYVNGHTEFSGEGTLNLTGNVKHAFTSDEYCQVKKSAGTIKVISAKGDGFHIGQYLQLQGGKIEISSVGDGVDVGAKKDPSTENNGELIIESGTLTATVSGDSSDAMKCEGAFTQSGGTLVLKALGNGGRPLSADGAVSISGGRFEGVACGGLWVNPSDSTDDRKGHGIKSDASITISGGEVYVGASFKKGVAFKTDYVFAINGGTVMGIGAKASTPSLSSSQASKTYTATVAEGATVSFDGVTYKVPAEYSCSAASILVSK